MCIRDRVCNHHLRTAVSGKTCSLTSSGAVHPAAACDVVNMLHESSLLVLHHDHSITEGSDSVCTAGACETGLGLHIVTLSEDTCGVYVSVGVDPVSYTHLIPVIVGIYGTNPAGGGYHSISPTILIAHSQANICLLYTSSE